MLSQTGSPVHLRSSAALVSRNSDSSHNSRAGHPGWLRCSSLTYSRYARSSRLVIRAGPPVRQPRRGPRAPRSGTQATIHGDETQMFDLSGKVALVTGASRGIGRATAQRLAEQGATVIAAARGDHAAGCVADITGRGHRAEALSVDVTDASALERVPAGIIERHGRLDVVVSNAGITRDQLLIRMKRAEWDAVLATNLTATFVLAQAAMRPMLKQRGGRIIAVSSVVGQMGNAGQTNYAASKAGLIGFVKALAREVASRGITVNAIAPGMIDTEMTRTMAGRAQIDWSAQIPVGRMGAVDDIAAAVCFLASDEASYITGHVLAVNGGMYM